MRQGRKGEKGSTSRAPVIMTDNNGLPTGFIEGPPGPQGRPGVAGKKVRYTGLIWFYEELNSIEM